MTLERIVTAVAVSCAALVIVASPGLAAQATPKPQHAATDKAKPPSEMAAKCQAMMAGREKMMAEMKAADQRLDGLVATMNAASGAEKTTATAAVVTDMVAQRRTMRDGMMKMQEGMMGHMMEHMQEGKDSMAMCPMMKQMGGMKH
jgi:hypothetical protein